MSEPTTPTLTDPTTELATLRRVNAELVAKSATRKARVTELEASMIELQGKLTASETAAHTAAVTIPLQQLSESLSPVPTLWLKSFSEHFKVESKDGKLSVLTNEGESIKDVKGQPVPFERSAIAKYLTESEPESERTKLFRVITATSFASGAGAAPGAQNLPSKTASKSHFGLH
jgi:hypothetical protein